MSDEETKKVVINAKHGGFGLSDAAYEKLAEWGVPVVAYNESEHVGRCEQVIFDRDLTNSVHDKQMQSLTGNRYWEDWTDKQRTHPLLIRVVEELGTEANARFAGLKIVEVPVGVEWEISEYDGWEHVAEVHRTWH